MMISLNSIFTSVNQGLDIARANLFWTVVFLGIGYYILHNTDVAQSLSTRIGRWTKSLLKVFATTSQHTNNVISYREVDRNSSSSSSSRPVDLQRIRDLQQEQATQRALEAEEQRKIKKSEERKRKNEIAQQNWQGDGHVLGKEGGDNDIDDQKKNKKKSSSSNSTSTTRSLSLSMQPFTANSRGYRPARRVVNRGWGR